MGDKDRVGLTLDFLQDLNWFQKFTRRFNGTVFFDHRPIKATVELDACLVGLGSRWQDQVYHISTPSTFKNFNIAH